MWNRERQTSLRTGLRAGSHAAPLVVTLLLLAAPHAHAGNRSTYLLGGRSAAMGGAWTAFGDDGSAAWYNPAALSLIDRHSFDLAASAYGFEIIKVPNMVQTTLQQNTKRSDFSSSALAIVPTSLDVVYRITAPKADIRHVLAFSVLVPIQRNISQTFEFSDDAAFYKQKFRIDDQETRYFVGPSYGVWLSKSVSIGASLFAVYDQVRSSASVYLHQNLAAQDGTPQDWFILVDQTADGMSLGLTAAGSVHLRFGGFQIGAQVRSPVFRIYSSVDVTDIQAGVLSAAVLPTPQSEFVDLDRSESAWGFRAIEPLAVTLGLGWDVPRSWRLGVDVTWHASLVNEDAVDYRNTFNVAVGAEVWLTDSLPLSFGIFTDFAPEEGLEGFGSRKMNYYGGSVAITMLSPYDVRESEKTDRITFATTIGVHYAYGTGTAVGMAFDLNTSFDPTYPERTASGHDVHAFVSSSVRF